LTKGAHFSTYKPRSNPPSAVKLQGGERQVKEEEYKK